MTRFFILITFILSCSLSYSQQTPNLYKNVDQTKMEAWVDSVFDSMTLDERIGQLFMIVTDPGRDSNTTNRVLKYIENQKIGGVLFAGGALSDQAASTNLYQKNSRIPLLISFDGEWGLAMRLSETPRFPKNILLGAVTDNQLIHNYGEEMGRECRKLGVHINFAPVLDVNNNPSNPVIGTRSFGESPQDVSEKGIAYAKGLESTGVMAVGKHFPGHGDTSDDSHKTLPLISHNPEHLNQVELYPFKQFINSGFAGIMTGHLSVPALDSTSVPTSLSPIIINELLKKKLGFEGLAFTDALDMKGAGSGSVCVKALLAGNDILLKPAKPIAEFDSVKKAIENGILNIELIEEKCLKVLRYKYIAGLNNYSPIDTDQLYSDINSNYSKWLIQKLNAEGMTLLKNQNSVIPVTNLAKTRIAILSLGTDEATTFEEILSLYGKTDCFQIPRNAKETAVNSVFKKIENYDLIICAIHSDRMPDYVQLQKLNATKKVILCFFTSPYSLKKYRQNVSLSEGIVMAYENTVHSQGAAAQLIMGGIPAKGKLPVSISGLYKAGTGLSTTKTRLSYFSPLEAGVSPEKLQIIDNIARNGIKEKAYPGCQILVAKNGVIIYNKSFGYFDYANTHPVENTDIYDLASVTKATATLSAVMKLYDANKIELQDKLSAYIPVLKNTDKEDITIKSALFHQSGLMPFIPFYRMAIDEKSYTGPLYSSKRDLTYRILYDENVYMRTDFEFKSDLVSNTLKQGYGLQVAKNFYLNNKFKSMILDEIVSSKLRSNTKYLYSDLNFMLLKEVVETVSKRKLDEFVENEIFSGLGANNTLFNPLKRIDTLKIAPTDNDEFLRGQILIGFVEDEAAAFMGGVSGHAGLFSNTNDLAKLLQMYLNGGIYGNERFFSEATAKLFTRTKSPSCRRGLGFDKPDKENTSSSPTGRLAPASTYGHTGYTGTCFWVDPDNQLIYIFLSNRVYPYRGNKKLSQLNIRTEIQDAIYNAIQ